MQKKSLDPKHIANYVLGTILYLAKTKKIKSQVPYIPDDMLNWWAEYNREEAKKIEKLLKQKIYETGSFNKTKLKQYVLNYYSNKQASTLSLWHQTMYFDQIWKKIIPDIKKSRLKTIAVGRETRK